VTATLRLARIETALDELDAVRAGTGPHRGELGEIAELGGVRRAVAHIRARAGHDPATVALRQVLTDEPAPWPAWADAAHIATGRLCGDVADLIAWTDRHDEDGWLHGHLAGADGQLRLRFELSEPGADRLQVQVTCPTDPTCRHAWDTVHHRGELISVLDGGSADGDPHCDIHDPQ
jgi:hypothetical protein